MESKEPQDTELRERLQELFPCSACEGAGLLDNPCTKHEEGELQLECTCGEFECPQCEGSGVNPDVKIDKVEAFVQQEIARAQAPQPIIAVSDRLYLCQHGDELVQMVRHGDDWVCPRQDAHMAQPPSGGQG